MTKFVNRIDHVAWVSHLDTVAENVAALSRTLDVKFEGPHVDDLGYTLYLSWEAGLEILAPHPERTEFNQAMHDHLDTRGEGLFAIVFGVRDLAERRQSMIDKGLAPSEIWGEIPGAPWNHKLTLKEMDGGRVVNTRIVIGEIEYADDVVEVD